MTTGRFLVILLAAVFFGEAVSLLYVSNLRPLSKTEEVLVGTSFLTLILAPLLYYILLRPLQSGIRAKERAEQELKSLSLVDHVTGLYNPRGFYTLTDHQIKLAERQMKKTFLLHADMDNLREIDDKHGHDQAERAVVHFADILQATYRKTDIIGRLGDDEFAVYPVETENTEETARIVVDRFQKNLDSYNAESTMDYKLSANVGISPVDTAF